MLLSYDRLANRNASSEKLLKNARTAMNLMMLNKTRLVYADFTPVSFWIAFTVRTSIR